MGKYNNIYLGEWVVNEEYDKAYKLWLEYHYKCELFDSKVCTGSNKYEEFMPSNHFELGQSRSNANKQREVLNIKRKCLEQEGVIIPEKTWQSAKNDVSRYKLGKLEEEYNYYFGEGDEQ